MHAAALPIALLLLADGAVAAAQSPADQSAAEQPAPTGRELDERLEQLEEDNRRLQQRLDALEEAHGETRQQAARAAGRISGYLDVGFFAVQGNGSGVRADLGYQYFPRYTGMVPDSWVFFGDPLSTTINSRGEPADTGDSRALVFDPVDNRGKPSFIVNALNLSLFAAPADTVVVQALVDFVPRSRDVSNPTGTSLGDFVDVKLAYVEYQANTDWMLLSLYAGKIDGVLGIEYRTQESPDRINVTPSLICRYTCGRPLGIKARARFLDESLTAMLAVTNGSHVTEMFPFYGEIDRNVFKTVAGRVSYTLPFANLEIGASGLIGAQDNQTSDDRLHEHFGFDLHLEASGFEMAAEFVKGEIGSLAWKEAAQRAGRPVCDDAPCLEYQGAYGLFGYHLANWLMPYARVDYRDAEHRSGASFVYVTNVLRATFGLHLEFGTHSILKAEYTVNRELGDLPPIPNDVFTSSLVVKF